MPSDPVEATLAAWGAIGLVHADDPAALAPALQIARRHLAALGRACDRRSARAEVHRMPCAAGAPVTVSPLLARVVQASLEIAAQTGGLVDPTVRVGRPGSGG